VCAYYYTARRFPLSTRSERLAFLFVLLTLSHRSLTLYPARFIARHTHSTQPRCRVAPMTACECTCCIRIESYAYSLRHLLAIQNQKDVVRLRTYYVSHYSNDLRNYGLLNFIPQLFHVSDI